MNRFHILFFIALLLACSPKEETVSTKQPSEKKDKTVDKKVTVKIETLDKLPQGMKTLGNQFITGRRWSDNNGENLVLFTLTKEVNENHPSGDPAQSYAIYAEHFAKKEGATDYTLLRKIQDFENECILENMLMLEEKSISITDLDQDNYKEISFIYTLGCRSDPSKYPMKLMLLENGDKYAVRGYTRPELMLREQFGENATFPESTDKSFDPTFKEAPAAFKEFVNKLWNEHDLKK